MNRIVYFENEVQANLDRVRTKYRRGVDVSVLLIESTTNTSKVSLISALIHAGLKVFVLSHEKSEIANNLYSKLGVQVILGGTLQNAVDVSDADILFLDNPHYYVETFEPTHDFYKKIELPTFEKLLICYIPYAYIAVSDKAAYTDFFHRFSWKFFLESEFHFFEYLKHTKDMDHLANAVITGHPYLDPYFTDRFDYLEDFSLREGHEKVVVWCPHHNEVFYNSLSFWDQERLLRRMLEQTNDLKIVFRPHPNLFSVLGSSKHVQSKDYLSLMNRKAMDRFTEFWFNHPRVLRRETGPIYQLFKSSHLIIHNGGGYQMEAIMSGANVINLINQGLLNSRMNQFHSHQYFPMDDVQLMRDIEKALSMPRRFEPSRLYGTLANEAGSAIVSHILNCLS